MKKLLFLCCILSGLMSSSAQSLEMVETSWQLFDVNMDSAIHMVEKGYYEAQKEGNLKAMGRALTYRAVFYDINGKPDSALFLFFKALPIQESIRDTEGLITTYNNLGIFNFSQYQFPQAMMYYKKAYECAMMLKDYSSAAGSLVNMGVIESYNPNGGKALEYYSEAEKLYMKDGDSASLYPILSNTAKIYLDRGEYTKAYECNLKSVRMNDDLKSMTDWLTERILMTNILGKMKKWTEAEKYGLEGLKLAEENDLPERRQYMYEALSNVYYGMGNYKKAYEFTSKYRDLRDSLINGERSQQIAQMQVKFETEKQNNEITQLKLDAAEKKNFKLENERLHLSLNILAIGGTIVLVVVAILVVLLILTIRLERKNTRLESEKKQQTQALLEQEKILMRESHHRIKNNLQLINSILDLQSRSIDDPETKKIFKESRQRIQAISFAHQRLQGNDTVEKLNLKDFLTDLIHSIESASLDPSSNIKVRSNIENIVVSTEKAVPIGLILNELFTNALKYAFGPHLPGEIKIDLVSKSGKLEMVVADNGSGMQKEPQGTGFGHQLVKSMTRQLKAEYFLNLESGVQHRFLIPLS